MKIVKKHILITLSLITLIGCSLVTPRPVRKIASLPTVEQFLQYSPEQVRAVIEREDIVQDRKIIEQNFGKYMIQAYGESDSVKVDLAEQGQKYLRTNTVKHVNNIYALLRGREKTFDITDAPQWTLNEEIKYLNRTLEVEEVVSNNQIIDQYLTRFRDVNISDSALSHLVPEGDEDLIIAMKSLQTSQNSSELYLNAANAFEKKLTPYFNRIQNLGEELERNADITFGNPEAEKFIKGFLNYYYQEVEPDVLKSIISDLARLGAEPTQDEVIATMFKNSGPGLGKTLQQLGKDPSMGQAMAKMMEVLEDEGKPVPYHLVQDIVADDSGYHFYSVNENPLGTGTVAQVHKAEIKYKNKPTTVALRFLKPEVDIRAKDDIRILKAFVEKLASEGDVSKEFLIPIRKMVSSIESFLYSELDIKETIKKQKTASRVYTQDLNIDVDGKKYQVEVSVPRIYAAKRGSNSNLHVQEFLKLGEKFSDIRSKKQKKAISRSIVKIWFEEALLNSGFFHSDLHQGNFALLEDGNRRDNKLKLALFDFGMSDKLKMKTKRSFLLITVGAKYNNADLISRGILSISQTDPPSRKLKALAKIVENQMKAETFDSQEWIIWAMKNGHLESEQLGTLARGGTLVSQLPKLVNDWEYTEDMVEDLLRNRMQGEYFSLNYDFPLTRMDVLRAGGARISSGCKSAMGFFFK